MEYSTIKTKRQKRTILQKNSGKTNREQHLIQWKKNRAEFKSLAKKNKKENWEKFAKSLNSNTPKNQTLNRERQLKGKDKKN